MDDELLNVLIHQFGIYDVWVWRLSLPIQAKCRFVRPSTVSLTSFQRRIPWSLEKRF